MLIVLKMQLERARRDHRTWSASCLYTSTTGVYQFRETAHVLKNGLKGEQLMVYICESWVGGGGAESASRLQPDGFRSV